MLKLFLQSKILISIWIGSLTIISSLFFFIPYITEKNITELVIQNSKNTVEQIKLTRTYYLDSVVNDINKNNLDLTFSANHIQDSKILPLPATLIHDLSEIYSENTGIKFRTYSNYPFKNRADRVLDEKDLEIIEGVKEQGGVFVLKDKIKNKPVLKVAIADYMLEQSCVECHNNHPARTWQSDKWKVGDIRGVIEVITPLSDPIKKNEQMRNIILVFISAIFLLLIIYYSYMLVKREDELLKINDILDKRVKQEIQKNRQKEQILVQKAKQSSMGEMINSIAHQWRQPLTELSTILVNLDLRYSLGKLDKELMNQKVQKSEKILEFMSHTIEDFRSFFKVDKKRVKFNLQKLCLDTLNILNMTLKNNSINVDLDIKKDIFIYGYKNEFSQVLLNLLVNSKDAFLKNSIKNGQINIRVKEGKKDIEIFIQDNAGGIEDSIVKDIFDLYFTTKATGSGIGLYISKVIIENHFKGQLEVKNIANGVEFKISLQK